MASINIGVYHVLRRRRRWRCDVAAAAEKRFARRGRRIKSSIARHRHLGTSGTFDSLPVEKYAETSAAAAALISIYAGDDR